MQIRNLVLDTLSLRCLSDEPKTAEMQLEIRRWSLGDVNVGAAIIWMVFKGTRLDKIPKGVSGERERERDEKKPQL